MANPEPKILLFDIETAPTLAWVWGLYQQDVIAIEKDWYIISFVAKWLDKKKAVSKGLPDYALYKKEPENDRELCKDLWELLDEADIVIAHNGDKFDIRKANARFIEHGLPPPQPYKSIDTLKIARKYFKFDSNRLDELGRYLKVGRKVHTGGWKLWQDCLRGDMKAWRKMIKYNKQDVLLLEEVYKKLRPWITNHPNINLYQGTLRNCPNCGSSKLQKRGFQYTNTIKYQQYWWKNCGRWPRSALKETSVLR